MKEMDVGDGSRWKISQNITREGHWVRFRRIENTKVN